MNLITVVIIVAIILTSVIALIGIFSMTKGVDTADRQVKLARAGTIIMTLWILVLAFYLYYN